MTCYNCCIIYIHICCIVQVGPEVQKEGDSRRIKRSALMRCCNWIGTLLLEVTKNVLRLISGIWSHWLSSHLGCGATFCSCNIVRSHIQGGLRQGVVTDNINYPLRVLAPDMWRFLDTDNHAAVLWQPVSKVTRVCVRVCLNTSEGGVWWKDDWGDGTWQKTSSPSRCHFERCVMKLARLRAACFSFRL